MAKQDQGADTFKVDQSLDQDEMGKEIASYWVKWDAAKDIAKERWLETTQYVYATSTQETTNSQNGWSHSTHVPKLTQISDNLAANYMSLYSLMMIGCLGWEMIWIPRTQRRGKQ